MVYIIKSIDVVSPATGNRHTSMRSYERELHSKGQDIWTDKQFKETRERLQDVSRSAPQAPKEIHNHVHIDFNNGKVITSKKDVNV